MRDPAIVAAIAAGEEAQDILENIQQLHNELARVLYETTLENLMAQQSEALTNINVMLHSPNRDFDEDGAIKGMVKWAKKLGEADSAIQALHAHLDRGEES